jgi:hypothetical protein
MLSILATPLSLATDGSDIVDECYEGAGAVPIAGSKACRTIQQFIDGVGRTCRSLAPAEDCVTTDGRLISTALVDAFVDSWVVQAMALQRGLDDGVPLKRELWVHTHNSYNAESYSPTFSGLDSNQIYSLTDQLRMGVRAIELDVHWASSPEGRPEDRGNAPIVCHGEAAGGGPIRAHIGCTNEVHLKTRLDEVRAWLDANAGEVVMIYLENALDGDAVAHTRASEAITASLGDQVFTPSSGGCESLPIDLSRSDIRAAGKRVLLTGDCGSGGPWTSLVFQRGERWKESSSPEGVEYPDYPACVEAERGPNNYAESWIRFYEDRTWLSAMVTGTGLGRTSTIPAEEARRMVRCGVNMPGFDDLEPFDPRLAALVWSWAENEPVWNVDGTCAFSDGAGGFRSDGCRSAKRFACIHGDGSWSVTRARGPWAKGEARCAKAGGSFAVPKSGYEYELLKAAAGSAPVWMDYRFESARGGWVPEASGI